MLTKNQKHITIIVIFSISAVLLGACSAAPLSTSQVSASIEDAPEVDAQSAQSVQVSAPAAEETVSNIESQQVQTNPAFSSELTIDNVNGLLFMREEEKLAHDVYIALYDQWGLSIFNNIAASEQTHTDAVKELLDTFGLPDPVIEKAAGEFDNQDLQALYDQLTTLGSQSISDALKVGAAIEEIDILDLENHLQETENLEIRTVYENLLKGSRNHLRSFTSTLNMQTGEIYQPQYLSTDDYQSIVGSGIESGGRGSGNRP